MKTGGRIAFLQKNFPWSGAEMVTMDVANYLVSQGYEVTILTPRHHPSSYPEGKPVLFQVEPLPIGNIKYSRKIAKAVRSFVYNHHIDVLVTYQAMFYASWLRRKTGVSIVYELHNTPYYEFLDIADKMRESRAQNLFYRCGVKWLLTRFYRSKYRNIYASVDAYAVLCDGYRDQVVSELKLSEYDNKVWVLPNSIAPASTVEWHKKKTIIYAGRLTHRDKRVDRLLRIWQSVEPHLSGWQLKLIGSGRAEPQLRQLAANLHLERCSFEGRTTRMKDYYDEAAILCMTSSFEGWPMVIAEAQSNGVIPVVFDSYRAARDMIATPDEGVLVPPFDETVFARELLALASDEPRMESMRQCIVRKAATYTIARSGEAWMAMIQTLKRKRQY